jgi:hypothetical protein
MRTLISIAVLGALLRIRQYVAGRSMWLDEIFLAESLRDKGLTDLLTTPLLHNQSAPPGYLLASKVSVRLLGANEYGLRLVALLSGLAALVLAVVIARRLLSHLWSQASFVALISLSPALIYYSNEVKQYSTDVLATCAVLALWSLRHSRHAPLILGIGGSLIAVISLVGIIGLGALGIAIVIEWLHSRTTRTGTRLGSIILMSLLWLPGVGLHLGYSLSVGTDRESMRNWWGERAAFAPDLTSRWLGADLVWYPEWLMRLGWVGIGEVARLGSTAATGPLALGIGLGVLAVVAITTSRELRWMLTVPILIALLLSQFRIYPTSGRLSLYLVPVVMLIAVLGAESLAVIFAGQLARTRKVARPQQDHKFGALMAAVAIATLLGIQASITIPFAFSPLDDRNIKWVMDHVEQHQQPGDTLILEASSRPMLWYLPAELNDQIAIAILRLSAVAETGVPDSVQARAPQRLWVASTHNVDDATQLVRLLVNREEWSVVCELAPAAETYLALLTRDPTADQWCANLQ